MMLIIFAVLLIVLFFFVFVFFPLNSLYERLFFTHSVLELFVFLSFFSLSLKFNLHFSVSGQRGPEHSVSAPLISLVLN